LGNIEILGKQNSLSPKGPVTNITVNNNYNIVLTVPLVIIIQIITTTTTTTIFKQGAFITSVFSKLVQLSSNITPQKYGLDLQKT